MKTLKIVGFASVASVALALTANAPSFAEPQSDSGTVEPGNVVHRVNHNLAIAEHYTASTPAGYKWAQDGVEANLSSMWVDNTGTIDARSGYKWSEENRAEQSGSKWGRRNAVEQSGSKWGRRNVAEQSGSKWGRRNVAEQSGSKWGRRNVAEQSGSKWGRR